MPVDGVDGLDVVTAGAHDCGALELDAPEAASGGVVVEVVVVRVVVVTIVVVRLVAMRVVVMRIEAVRIEDEVVALAISPGLGHAEAQAGGFGEKCGFGDFPASFAGDVGALDFAGGR